MSDDSPADIKTHPKPIRFQRDDGPDFEALSYSIPSVDNWMHLDGKRYQVVAVDFDVVEDEGIWLFPIVTIKLDWGNTYD